MYDQDGVAPHIVAIMIFIALIVGGCIGVAGTPPETSSHKKAYAELQLKYEAAMCDHRNLTLTTVKGITLCMDPRTRSLHKIEDKIEDKIGD